MATKFGLIVQKTVDNMSNLPSKLYSDVDFIITWPFSFLASLNGSEVAVVHSSIVYIGMHASLCQSGRTGNSFCN